MFCSNFRILYLYLNRAVVMIFHNSKPCLQEVLGKYHHMQSIFHNLQYQFEKWGRKGGVLKVKYYLFIFCTYDFKLA